MQKWFNIHNYLWSRICRLHHLQDAFQLNWGATQPAKFPMACSQHNVYNNLRSKWKQSTSTGGKFNTVHLKLIVLSIRQWILLGNLTGLSVYIAWRFNHPVHSASNIHCLNMFLDRDDFATRSRLDYLISISRPGRFERLFGKRALRKEIWAKNM